MSAQFKVNGFAILGSLLQNFEVSEELFGVLVCMMLGMLIKSNVKIIYKEKETKQKTSRHRGNYLEC
jgi:hypothetical protein